MSKADAIGILRRDGFRCVRCGKPVAYGRDSIHHRILGNRKDNRPSNLIALCGSGTTGCHGWVHSHPAEAREYGWIVSRFTQRALTPDASVFYAGSGWRLLLDNFTMMPVPPPGGEDGSGETRNT